MDVNVKINVNVETKTLMPNMKIDVNVKIDVNRRPNDVINNKETICRLIDIIFSNNSFLL